MNKIMVGIIMGSDSDLEVMNGAVEILNELDITCEVSILSAHRTPQHTVQYVEDAAARGLRVIIAGAGAAAHLAGVAAAHTPLPVIGVPIKSGAMEGMDSLYSTVQMPPGIPVATVGINGAKNAGILAAQIIGSVDLSVRQKIENYKEKLAAKVEEKNNRLQKLGIESFLEQK
ncbi:MAG: 5-(carboxyamino)imidazole ribonucleotide mutase [Clostridiales bacterium]|nr:5-(carboxyamino)imidazole ribonucleotide mutase [Clostridiales bacterium]MCF8021689.1 5-(carboxyamino)imidazole ribonucleotide mutase [Clostridiales bacterium]